MATADGALPPALEEQRAFIRRPTNEPALLAAGPGTGKTWVLERRSEFLVGEGVQPDRISILTLTRSLAAELSSRIPHGTASTLHSFSLTQLNLLRDAWGKVVVSPWEQRELVRQDLDLGHAISFGSRCGAVKVDRFLKRMGTCFRDGQDEPTELSEEETRLYQVFLYHRELFGYRLLDELANDLVRVIEAGAELPRPPTHLIVDEYQDLTSGELRMLQLMKERFGAILNAAGDDRQSIYGFREADALALHRFPAAYSVDEPSYLWRSKRCPLIVCGLANRLAATLPNLPGLERRNLEPWPGRVDEGELTITSYPSSVSEARGVVARCQLLLAAGFKPSEIIVVVAAYHAPVFKVLCEAATEAGMPDLFVDPRCKESDVPTEMRLAASCARLLLNPRDQLAWRTLVWATPQLGTVRQRKILEGQGATYLLRLRDAGERDATVARTVRAGDAVLAQFAGRGEIKPRELVRVAAEHLGLALDEEAMRRCSNEPARPAEVMLKLFELDEASGDEEVQPTIDGIAVHTVFSSKGLEAPHVFLVNAVNQSLAGRGDPADGIRLAYVAVTRASSSLHISAPRYVGHSALGNQMGVEVTRVADLLVDNCRRIGVQLVAVASGGADASRLPRFR
ncbi:MAG: ATP-dependent helicase [Acidimicrobiales bacterium]